MVIKEGVRCAMDASQLHTIYVPKGKTAAWWVLEGAEWPEYRHICYTNNTNFDPSYLYEEMTDAEIEMWAGYPQG